MTDDTAIPRAAAVLHADGETCATLTPLIRTRIGGMSSGTVLEVCTDDPAAREGVPAWSRLTGNELLSTIEEAGGRSRFYLKRK